MVNKRLTNEMIKRQEEILSNLLKHEKAEREKDQDEKRKGKTDKKITAGQPAKSSHRGVKVVSIDSATLVIQAIQTGTQPNPQN